MITAAEMAARADVLHTISALKGVLSNYDRMSKRMRKNLIDTLDFVEMEITDLRARSKPRLVKRRR